MLILSRRPGEQIMIGDDVILTILEIKGKQVRVGIEAPINVTVHRQEVWARIQAGEVMERLAKEVGDGNDTL